MARPNKIGLDYFPLDVDIFEDEKMVAISGEFGLKGEITVIKLLCAIYRNGYFILWNDLLKFKLLRNLPGVSLELLESIVNRLVLWGFFDKALFDSVEVLTSKGIQTRYFSAARRRKTGDDLPYLLVSVDGNWVNVDNNPVNVNINAIKKRKEKEIKIKKETPLKGYKEKPATADFSSQTPVDNSRKDAAADAAGLSADPSNPSCPAGEETPPPGSAPPPSPKRKVFKKPTVDEIRAYCAERHNSVDAEYFYDHYEANGWKIGGKSPMKDWRAAVRTWEKNNYTSYGRKEQQKFGNTRPGDFVGKGYTDI